VEKSARHEKQNTLHIFLKMKKFFILLFLACSSLVFSQQLQWVQNGNYLASHACGIAMDQDSQYVAGSFYSSSLNRYWYFVNKYDQNGTLLWTDTCGAYGGPQCAGVVSDQFGNAYVSVWTPGWNNQLILNNSTYPGGGKILLIKYNPQGQILWVNCQSGQFESTALTINSQNQIFVSGKNGNGGFVKIYNSAGNCIQTISLPGQVYDIALDPSGNIFTSHQHSLTKWSPTGLQLWAFTTSGAGRIGVDLTGNCYFTRNLQYYGQTILIKINASGQLDWTINSSNGENGSAIFVDAFGYIYTCGEYAVSQNALGAGSAKYDSNGNLLWYYLLQNPNSTFDYEPTALVVKNTMILACGFKQKQNSETFVMKLSEGLATTSDFDKSSTSSLSVLPNPTNGQFTVNYKSSKHEAITLQIDDANGKCIYSKVYPDFNGEFIEAIDLGNQPKGVYMVTILAGRNKETRKVIVE
jgi:hypothetical protein